LWLGDALCPLADSATSKLPAAATATAAYSDTTAATSAAAYNDTTAAATTAAATHGAGTLGGDLVTKLRLGAFLVEDIVVDRLTSESSSSPRMIS
jgi:hypothetical protein